MTFERIAYKACPLCGSDAFQALRSGDCRGHALYRQDFAPTIDWMRCEPCGHVFTSGYFAGEALAALISKTQECQQPGYQLEQQRIVAAELIEWASVHVPYISARWLDVGFGAGALLTTAAEYGFAVTGTELRAENVQALASFGFDVRCAELSEMADTFDIISMCDVLEHVPSPVQQLRYAHGLLSASGVLVLSMPNSDSFVWRVLDAAGTNPYWGELEHYHNFGRARLESLLRDNGFRPLAYSASRRYRACMQMVARKQ